MQQVKDGLITLRDNLIQISKKLDLQSQAKKLRELESESMKKDFWADEEQAKNIMREISDIKELSNSVSQLETRITDNLKLVDLALGEKLHDEEIEKDLRKETMSLKQDLEKLELQTFLSDPHDSSDAILSIHAGQGGTEAMDWAAILLRMYMRFIERKLWKAELLSERPGEEAGIKAATLMITGKYAYGLLKNEAGVHRLVRQSPFNADQLRQTSFALVEILPRIQEPKEVKLNEEDIQFQAFRSSGHGGQNVNKVATAVRLKHIPSKIVVECQAQRHQEQNRKIAMQLLAAKLWEKQQKEHKEKVKSLKGKHKIAGWGNQIRSYVLHPYHLVKDLRTQVETQDTQAVLDGKLDDFIQVQVRQLSQ